MSLSRWKQFSALIPAAALAFLDQTILPVALPEIQKEMQATNTALQWCVNSYLLTIAIFVLISGKWGDKIGHKKTLMLGVLTFVVCSIFCSLSGSVGLLIAARALQGIGAALMFPAQTTLIAAIFPPEQRGRASGMIVSIGSLFLILGPLIGGYLVEVASWRWIFWINVPIGAIGLWQIYKFLPNTGKREGKIDVPGFLLFAAATSALTLVFMQAATWGWTSMQTLLFSLIGLIGLIFLLYREKKTKHPFLDLSLFKHPVFAAINLNVFTVQFFLMISVFRTIYFQEILGFTPFLTGSILFLASLPVFLVAPLGGYLSDRVTPKLPIALGYLSLIFSSFWFGFVSEPSFFSLNAALIAFGIGLPLIFTPSYSSAIASVPQRKAGAAAGIITTLRMVGGTMGLALIHLFVSTVQESHIAEGQRQAEITSFSYVHFALGFLLIVAFAITFILHSRKSAHHLPESPAEGWD